MNTTTLRGVFPKPKPVHKRNFVRENIKQLKDMQDYIQESKIVSKSQEIKPDKFKHVAPKVYSNLSSRRKSSSDSVPKKPMSFSQYAKSFKSIPRKQKIFDKGVQTERPEDLHKLYERGVLKYPSPSVTTPKTVQKSPEQGDAPQSLVKNMQKLDLEEKQNFVKQNIKLIKNNKQKGEGSPDPLLPPSNYQKGSVPKYLKGNKTTKGSPKQGLFDGDHGSGLVLLPDDERKEYLRVARENYAALIKELNGMPMSNDTLKQRKRKIEIEEELKRLDEVIKIFQKPKVFVKADA